ncbi:DUF4965 domain-containing protein [bacterium]|nr:DUF4965 domain-containing protein [candidate division CSSED10-310 bacterium]
MNRRVSMLFFFVVMLTCGIPDTGLSVSKETHPWLLARLGSRFTIVPDIETGTIRILPLGSFLPETAGISCDISFNNGSVSLPSSCSTSGNTRVSGMGLTGIEFHEKVPDVSVDGILRITSLFTPERSKWRTAPVMLIQAGARNYGSDPLEIVVRFHPFQHEKKESITTEQSDFICLRKRWAFAFDQRSILKGSPADHVNASVRAGFRFRSPETEFAVKGKADLVVGGLPADGWHLRGSVLENRFTVPPGCESLRDLAISVYTTQNILLIDGSPAAFAYTRDFRGAKEAAREFLINRDRLIKQDNAFNTCFEAWSETSDYQNLATLAFQTFLANTWLMVLPDGSMRYSEWEGYPQYHATMDVVFNTSLFHFMLTPDLLGNMLANWPKYMQNGHMPHDMGKGLIIGKSSYPAPMTVEEDANFILLHYLFAAATGDMSLAASQSQLLDKIAESLLNADTDADGLPDKGTITTFDDAPQYISTAENQIYLGIKTVSALSAYLRLRTGDVTESTQEGIQEYKCKLLTTMKKLWEKDHYPVINMSILSAGQPKYVLHPFVDADEETEQKPVETTSAEYSNYLAHGMVPLLVTGQYEKDLSGLKLDEHLAIAHRMTTTEYGDAHAEGQRNVWVSQNMWRDIAGMYMGVDIDTADMLAKYWHLQMLCRRKPQSNEQWQFYCDSPVNGFLSFYSRGVPVLFYPWAMRGVTFNRLTSNINVRSPGKPFRLPMPFLADWKESLMPVLVWSGSRNDPDHIENADLLENFALGVQSFDTVDLH